MFILQNVPRGEAAVWVEQWVNCAKQLTQWDTLLEYARQADNTSLMTDALWRVGDFDNLKVALTSGKVRRQRERQATRNGWCTRGWGA